MDAIDTQEAKITKMHEYISKCRAALTASEDAEFAKRMRQYWSAAKNCESLMGKTRDLDEETQRVLKARAKTNNIIFIVALLASLAIQYFEFVERSTQIILVVAFIAYLIIKEIAYQLETNKNEARLEGWKAQVDFYKHEMNCSGGGSVEYENEYMKAKKNEDIKSEEIFYKLYLLSVEIAILQGLKSERQFVNF
jgi:hypothetical protein